MTRAPEIIERYLASHVRELLDTLGQIPPQWHWFREKPRHAFELTDEMIGDLKRLHLDAHSSNLVEHLERLEEFLETMLKVNGPELQSQYKDRLDRLVDDLRKATRVNIGGVSRTEVEQALDYILFDKSKETDGTILLGKDFLPVDRFKSILQSGLFRGSIRLELSMKTTEDNKDEETLEAGERERRAKAKDAVLGWISQTLDNLGLRHGQWEEHPHTYRPYGYCRFSVFVHGDPRFLEIVTDQDALVQLLKGHGLDPVPTSAQGTIQIGGYTCDKDDVIVKEEDGEHRVRMDIGPEIPTVPAFTTLLTEEQLEKSHKDLRDFASTLNRNIGWFFAVLGEQGFSVAEWTLEFTNRRGSSTKIAATLQKIIR